MRNLSIDIETYSGANLSKCGVYRYSEESDFTVLLFGYSVDGSDVQVVDLTQLYPDGDSNTMWAEARSITGTISTISQRL